jgi:hypothetical protein
MGLLSMGEDVAIAAGTAAASFLLGMFLLRLDRCYLLLAIAAANRLLDCHHLVRPGFVGRPKPVS